MYRLLRETFVLIGAPAAIALAVLLAGTAIAQTPAEADPPAWWPVSECHTATVVGVGSSGVSGTALLCTADDAVRPAAYLSSLTPGRTYGVWLLASERWTDCRSARCSIDSAADSGYPGAFGRLGGVSAGVDGTAHVRGHLDGWSLASGAAVTLLVTNQTVGSAALHGSSGLDLVRPSTPRVGTASTMIGLNNGDVGSVVAVSVLRLP